MEAALVSSEYRVRQVLPDRQFRAIGGHRYAADLGCPESLRQLHAAMSVEDNAPVGAVINLLGLSEPFCRPGFETSQAPLQLAQWVFNVVKEFSGDLQASAKQGGGWLFNVTTMDGQFGLKAAETLPLAQAGTVGLCKSVSREWPSVRVKNIDVDPAMDSQLVFPHLVQEILNDDGIVEVGIRDNKRWKLELIESTEEPHSELSIRRNAVILVTGGAFGVTAEVVKELARQVKPHLVLVGRSPLPGPEDASLRSFPDAISLRKHLIQEMRGRDPQVTPKAIERKLERILKDRQIRANLAEITATGATVDYRALDVRNQDAFGGLIDELYARYETIDGVIHGAGVIEDALITQKTPESFERVFSTKVDPALVLARKLRGDRLGFLVFFSSVSARFGNAGQVDYSAANEVLNKLAAQLDARWPAQVVSINWGPWDGGMVSGELRRLYESHGIHLIPPAEGASMCISELARNGSSRPEVVIACNIRTIANRGAK